MPNPLRAIGIDLGTTYSCVAVLNADGGVEIIPNEQGNRTTPSYVSWDPATAQRFVGDPAQSQASRNPCNTVYSVKRLIGRKWGDETVQRDRRLWPFKVVPCSTSGAEEKDSKCLIEVTCLRSFV